MQYVILAIPLLIITFYLGSVYGICKTDKEWRNMTIKEFKYVSAKLRKSYKE